MDIFFDGGIKAHPTKENKSIMYAGWWCREHGSLVLTGGWITGDSGLPPDSGKAEFLALVSAVVSVSYVTGIKDIHVFGDSMVTIEQANGTWSMGVPAIFLLRTQYAMWLQRNNITIEYTHVKREENGLAHELAAQALVNGKHAPFYRVVSLGGISMTAIVEECKRAWIIKE